MELNWTTIRRAFFIMHHSTTRSLLAGLFLASVVLGQEHPRACKAVQQLIESPGCRLTECRLGWLSTVLLGSEEGPRFETRGDLTLLDHECDAKSTIPGLFAAQKQKLRDLGFAVEGSEQVKENFGAIVFQKDGHWLELTGLWLEGAPTMSLRSVRTDGKTQARVFAQSGELAAEPAVVAPPVPLATVPAMSPEASTASGADHDRQPKVVARTEAVYPVGLEQNGAAGISIEVALDDKGVIARILSTKGNPALLTSALQAVRNWTFEPALASGKPVPGILQLDVIFKTRR